MPIPVLQPASGLADLFVGLGLPVRALRLIFSTPRLLGLSLLCAAVTAATLAALLILLWPISSRLAQHWVGDGGWRSYAGAGLSALLYLVLLVISALTVPSLVLAPLQDPLSEATETRLGNFHAPPFSLRRMARGTLASVVHTSSRLVLTVIGFALLAPLNFVPGVGSALYAGLSTAWAIGWVAAEYLSAPMARHLLPFSSVLNAMRARPWLALGMGAALYVVLWVPILNCFLVPLAVVAGTILFRALQALPSLQGT